MPFVTHVCHDGTGGGRCIDGHGRRDLSPTPMAEIRVLVLAIIVAVNALVRCAVCSVNESLHCCAALFSMEYDESKSRILWEAFDP